MRLVVLLVTVLACLDCAPIMISDMLANRSDSTLAALLEEAAIDPDRAGVVGLILGPSGLVTDVVPCSPASAANVEDGDLVQAIDGRALNGSYRSLAGRPGTEIRLTVLHDGASREITLTRMEWRAVFRGDGCHREERPTGSPW